MLIDYSHSARVLGKDVAGAIDSQTLTPEDAAELFNLVDSANFFSLPSEIPCIAPLTDGPYIVTIELAGEKHTVNTSGPYGPMASALEPLFNWLDEHLKNKN